MCIKTLEAPTGKHQEEELTKQRREVAVLTALALHPNIIRWVKCVLRQRLDLVGIGVWCLCWGLGFVAQPCSGYDFASSRCSAGLLACRRPLLTTSCPVKYRAHVKVMLVCGG